MVSGPGSDSDPRIDRLVKYVQKFGSINQVPVQYMINLGYPSHEAAVMAYSHYQLLNSGNGNRSDGGNSFTVSDQWMRLAKGIADRMTNDSPPANPIAKELAEYNNADTWNRKPSEWEKGNLGPVETPDKATPAFVGPQEGYVAAGSASPALMKGLISNYTPQPNGYYNPHQAGVSNIKPGGLPYGNGSVVPNNAANTVEVNSVPSFSMQQPVYAPLPAAPNFDFELNDFTDKASQLASQAYSPQFAAIQEAKGNVKENYQMAQRIVQGLYQKLLGQIEENSQDMENTYQQTQASNVSRGQQTRENIGDTYQAAQQQITNLIQKLSGGASAAAAVLPESANEQAYQQSRSLNNQQDFGNFLSSQGAAAQDYQNAIQQAQATQGSYSQQNLLNQRNNVLSGWDQQKLSLEGDQAQNAQSIAQMLAQRDLALQKLNYGTLMDNYNARVNNIQSGNQQAQKGWENAFQQWQAEQNQNQWQQQFDWQKGQDKIHNVIAGMGTQQANVPATPDVTDPLGMFNQEITRIAGGDKTYAQVLKDLTKNVMGSLGEGNQTMGTFPNAYTAANAFGQAASKVNQQYGNIINLDDARRVGAAIYSSELVAPRSK